MEIGGGAEQQQVSKCEGQPSEKQNLISSKESTPAKDTGTTVTRPRSQFNSEQSIESDNVSPPCVSFFVLMGRGNTVDVIPAVVDRGDVEIGGGAEQQQVSNCEGRPSKKQNLVLSKESTPVKDTGTTVTRPRSQFNSEQSIKSDNVSPPRVSFFALMGQKDNGKNLCKQGWGI